MKLAPLRWILLPVAVIALVAILWGGATRGKVSVLAACGLGWYVLSRLKVHSLDRERFGIPERRR